MHMQMHVHKGTNAQTDRGIFARSHWLKIIFSLKCVFLQTHSTQNIEDVSEDM